MGAKKDYIKISKGLDIPLQGAAQCVLSDARHILSYAVQPSDFVGLVPKLLVAEGDTVSAGSALFCDKNDPRILFPSPVKGVVKTILRGEKRRLLAVVVQRSDNSDTPSTAPTATDHSSSGFSREQLLSSGLWPLLRQRPFGTVALPDSKPKGIFISCFDSAPLAPEVDFLLQGRESLFLSGLRLLTHLSDAPIHLSFDLRKSKIEKAVEPLVLAPHSQFRIHHFSGPHPAGNVGTQIAHIDPINKGDVVWTLGPQEVAILGHWALTGEYCPERRIAFAGPSAKHPQYYRLLAGAHMASLIHAQQFNPNYPGFDDDAAPRPLSSRFISGNVLSGSTIDSDGFLHFYDNLVTALPEGDYYDFMGWLLPGLRKFSFSRTFLSGILHPLLSRLPISPASKSLLHNALSFDTNRHGDVRPFVLTGQFERLFPFDIYPLQLIKAAIIGDIELMENLGIYEVEPEDFALCEFADASKTEIQSIIRNALEQCRKEAL